MLVHNLLPLFAAVGYYAVGAAAAPTNKFSQFQLKTVVTAGNTNKNNLYLESYHTGAGTADAVLTPEKPTTSSIYLNNTAIQFNYGSNVTFGTYLNMYFDVNYASWDYVTINSIQGPTNGFYFNNTASKVDGLGKGLKWNPNYPASPPPANASSEFGGWYACDWFHNVPQLFWIVRYPESNNSMIDTCSKVELVRESA